MDADRDRKVWFNLSYDMALSYKTINSHSNDSSVDSNSDCLLYIYFFNLLQISDS